jgi:hypothetical protein
MDRVYGTAANDETEKKNRDFNLKSITERNIKHYLNDCTANKRRNIDKMQPIKQDRQPSGNIDY